MGNSLFSYRFDQPTRDFAVSAIAVNVLPYSGNDMTIALYTGELLFHTADILTTAPHISDEELHQQLVNRMDIDIDTRISFDFHMAISRHISAYRGNAELREMTESMYHKAHMIWLNPN